MRNRTAFSAVVLVVAALAVLAVVLFRDGDERSSDIGPRTSGTETGPRTAPSPAPKPKPRLPENPDQVRGTDDFALTRPRNLRRALAVLERERVRAEGVFDGLRVAPGRIDTSIQSSESNLNIQVRPDFRVAFRSKSAFPNANDARFRQRGIGARDVDVGLPARILRRIDRVRNGSAARDIDYFVIRRDLIDGHIGYGAYMRTGARPRIFLLEKDRSLRPIS
jgi:hypothetical protein